MTELSSTRNIRRTRVPHRCDHCGTIIPPGSAAIKWADIWDGDFYHGYVHHDCRALWLEAFDTYCDPEERVMPHDLVEAIEPDETRAITQAAYDSYRGRYPHVICRLELRWQRGDIKARDRYRALGLEPDPEDYPEVYG